MRESLKAVFLHPAVTVGIAAFIIHCQWRTGSRTCYPMFALLIFTDLSIAGFSVNHYARREFFTLEPALASTVRKEIGEGKYYRDENPRRIEYRIPANESVYIDRWNLETLEGYTAALYSIPVIYHEDYDDLAQKELSLLQSRIRKLPWNRRIPSLTAGGVRLILSANRIDHPSLRPVATVRNNSDTPFFLYRNLQASAAYWITSWDAGVTLENAYERITDSNLDGSVHAMIHGDRQPSACGSQTFEVRRTTFKNRSMSFHVTSECSGYLVLTLPYYRGWNVQVNGVDDRLVRANLAFSAVHLKEGTHRVDLAYLPFSFISGLILTILSSALLLLYFLLPAVKR